jgi:hypothetical protein
MVNPPLLHCVLLVTLPNSAAATYLTTVVKHFTEYRRKFKVKSVGAQAAD